MTTYTELLAGLNRTEDNQLRLTIQPDWMQGRTTYGGLTAALSLEAAQLLVDDIPIRTAQVAFIGPVGGEVSMVPTLLRRGKNTAFVSVDMATESGVGARTLFGFGAPRESALGFKTLPMPEVTAPEDTPSFFAQGQRPNFTNNFNVRQAFGGRPITGSKERAIGLWLRNKDEATPNDATAVLAIADCPPPAALSMFTQPAPISSMTWMAEFLTETPATEDGWWFSESVAETAVNGYSSQAMTLWNRAGEPVLVGRQTVAVFG